MKKILLLIALLAVCAVALFYATRKSDYDYVKDIVGEGEKYATYLYRENGNALYYIAFLGNGSTPRLMRIASKKTNAYSDFEPIKKAFNDVHSGLWVQFVYDHALQGEEAERGCNYRLVYVPEDKNIDVLLDSNKFNSVMVCKKK